jgi:hypothetical protein
VVKVLKTGTYKLANEDGEELTNAWIPSSRLRLARGCAPPQAGFAPFERKHFPRAGSASLEGSLPSGGFRLARGYVPPSARVRHARGRPSRVRRPPYTGI